MVFHQLANVSDPWWILVPAALAATIAAYAINAILVALHASLQHGLTVRQVLRKMHGSRPVEFLASYIGLALFGVVIARFFVEEGAWSVVVFLAPLVFARQMYFQSRMMADRLAEQNELLTAQADRLEHLLRKESATVDQLRELNRMKGEFVATVSHELRTPITAMIGYAKTLRQPQFADDAILREEFLGRMERQGNRLVGLVENLLTTSRLESDQLSISIGRVLFEDLCREAVEGLGTELDRVVTDVPEDIPVLHTDRQLLSRVITNLLDNALKYSPEDTMCELGARADGDSWCSGSAITASGSSRNSWSGSSIASTRWTRRPRADSAAPGWGCRWCATWCNTWAARSPSRARPITAARSRCTCRSKRRTRRPPPANVGPCLTSRSWGAGSSAPPVRTSCRAPARASP